MKWLTNLRFIVYARRAVIALERIAAAAEKRASVADLVFKSQVIEPRRPRPTEFGSMDTAAISKRYRAEREAAGEPLDEA